MRLAHCVRASMLSALAALLLPALAVVATAAQTDYPRTGRSRSSSVSAPAAAPTFWRASWGPSSAKSSANRS